MVQSEVLCRVLRINVGNKTGSSFTIEYNGVQFLVTAKHLFKEINYPANTKIKILVNNIYQEYTVDIKYPASSTIDIAVMKLNPYQILTEFYNNENNTSNMLIGQDVYFLGFPYEYDSLLQQFPNGNTPVPFVKKACMSSVIISGEDILLLLDGYNNPGFSGGPVCYSTSTDKLMKIAGVISGYRFEKQAIIDENDKELSLYCKGNTGIIYAYSIKHALDIAMNWN